jgi:hypothetical protein
VAVPAGANIRYGCLRTFRRADVTIHTCELHVLDVDIVRECDGLNRLRPIPEEVGYRIRDRGVGGRKSGIRLGGRCLPSQ